MFQGIAIILLKGGGKDSMDKKNVIAFTTKEIAIYTALCIILGIVIEFNFTINLW